MKIENMMGILSLTHLLFSIILLVTYIFAGEQEWAKIALTLSMFVVCFIYIPITVIIIVVKAVKRILN